MKRQYITIGRLSARTGVHVETIRYYEKIGLMPDPGRSQGGQRLYDCKHETRLQFIRRRRELGFSLDDIRSLLGLNDNKPSCAKVYEMTANHLETIRQKIKDLKRLEKTLAAVARDCDKRDAPDCPVIDALSGR